MFPPRGKGRDAGCRPQQSQVLIASFLSLSFQALFYVLFQRVMKSLVGKGVRAVESLLTTH